MRRYAKLGLVALLCLLTGAAVAADRPPLTRDLLKDNVKVKLISAKISDRRGRNLMVKFQTIAKEPKFIVSQFAAHSHTAHETTLMAVIRGCVDFTKAEKDGWHLAKAEVFFSLPTGDRRPPGEYSMWERCVLLGLVLPQADE